MKVFNKDWKNVIDKDGCHKTLMEAWNGWTNTRQVMKVFNKKWRNIKDKDGCH